MGTTLTTDSATKPAPKRPRMTAEQAVEFDAYSEKSEQKVTNAIEERRKAGLYPNCECEPYSDVYSFARWIAQGFAPRKGEKSLRLATFIKREDGKDSEPTEETEGDNKRTSLTPKTVFLFCRCQVGPAKPKKK